MGPLWIGTAPLPVSEPDENERRYWAYNRAWQTATILHNLAIGTAAVWGRDLFLEPLKKRHADPRASGMNGCAGQKLPESINRGTHESRQPGRSFQTLSILLSPASPVWEAGLHPKGTAALLRCLFLSLPDVSFFWAPKEEGNSPTGTAHSGGPSAGLHTGLASFIPNGAPTGSNLHKSCPRT